MDEKLFQRKIEELIQEIQTLPPGEWEKLEQLAAETAKKHKELKESMSVIQESIDYLRLSIKYILFDLEATRRENRYLRQMLENSEDEGF